MPAETVRSFGRDLILLLVGAIISGGTAITTNYLSDKREERKDELAQKLEFDGQLSRDLGKRWFASWELFKSNRDHDSVNTIKNRVSYMQVKEDWNMKVYAYQSLLRNYYGATVEAGFTTSIFNPLIDLGISAENENQFDTSKANDFVERSMKVRDSIVTYVSRIYGQAKLQ